MKHFKFFDILKNPPAIITIILIAFFFKGVFLAAIQPIFGGQDEARHYNTVQYLAEPKNAVLDFEKIQKKNDWDARDKDNFDTYNFSQEIQKTSKTTNTDILRGDSFNTIIFSDSFDGKNESEINAKIWKPYNYYSEPDIAGIGDSVYHKVVSQIERLLSDQTILVRFYVIRTFSVLLGTLAVFFCYLSAKTIGFSTKTSLILATILSFQPKFSLYFTNINYDVLLIPMFFLFTYAGTLALKKGLDWKNMTLLLSSMIIAFLTKPTGYILVVIFISLMSFFLYEKMKMQNKRFRFIIYGVFCLLSITILFYLVTHFLSSDISLTKRVTSIGNYISKTITFGKFVMPSETYWGTLNWTNSWAVNNSMNFIFIIEILAIIGLGLLLFSKKLNNEYPTFLPAKRYILFLIGMIVALQLGIRIADWDGFSQIGNMKMGLGTPGRYFLPNLSAHILLLGAGLGAILAYFKKDRYFETILISILILMFSLTTYLTFNAIILRFYF